MESRPRSVLAAFQEHLQLASTKCGSLMEQLNIVRKKVEGKEAMTMNVLDPASDDFLGNVSQKTVLQLEEMDLLGHKDVPNKEQHCKGCRLGICAQKAKSFILWILIEMVRVSEIQGKIPVLTFKRMESATTTKARGTSVIQMAVDNAYVERSTGDMNCDNNKPLPIRTRSKDSEIIFNKEEAPFLNGEARSNENEKYSLQFDGASNHKRPEKKSTKEPEKISGKTSFNAISGNVEETFNQDVSSDDSTLSSCSSSDDEDQGDSDNQNIYEELLKRLKDNEERKSISNHRSSSENSSSTFRKSQGTNKSLKKNSSNSTVIEENFGKKNGDMENLDVGVDFFLPSSVTEKFQEMFYEESGEENTTPTNNSNKDKNMRVTFDDLIVGRPKKHSLGGETLSENTNPQNRLPNETSKQAEVSPNQANQQIAHHRQKGKIKEKTCDAVSVKTKSDKTKKQNTTIGSSAVMNVKLNSPEMSLYKRLTGVPLKHEGKKIAGRKDLKSKKITTVNSSYKSKNERLKTKHIITEPKLKTSNDKNDIVAFNNSRNTKKEDKPPRIVNKTDKDGSIDMTNNNKNHPKNNFISASKNSLKKSEIEIVPTNSEPIKVDKVKPSSDANVKRDSLDESLNHNKEVKHGKIINLHPENQILKKNNINKIVDEGGSKEKKHNSDSKNLISKKNHVITEDVKILPKEKLVQTVKKTIFKEMKSTNTRIEQQKKNDPRTLTARKEISSKNNSVNDEIPAMNMKLKSNRDLFRPNTTVQVVQPKKESKKPKISSAKKAESLDTRHLQSLDKSSIRTKEPSEISKGRNHLTKETIHSQSISEMKTHTASFPFILGQSTSKTYNVRAAIQQTMSMIMRSPAETLRRSSFSEMLNVSSKASTLKTSASTTSGRKVCPACVVRVDEEDNEIDDNPIDPWDTEYHSKRFIRCTCMPRNTVNFKTVMNQLLHETSSSYILPTESYIDSEVENGQENRVNKSLFRKNNNIYKLSKLLHTLLKIRDLLVT